MPKNDQWKWSKTSDSTFEEEEAACIKAIKVCHKHQNLLQEHHEDLIPQTDESLEGCRKAFNKLANVFPTDQKQ